jgi:hypothetical protein
MSGSGFTNDIMHAENVDFSGDFPVTPKVTANGQLIIGSGVAPHLRIATLTAGTGISITNGAGSITISASGGSGIETINGDSGSITGSTVTIFANRATNNAGASVQFVNSGTTSTLNVTDNLQNTFIGGGAGSLATSGIQNTGFGFNSLTSITTGIRNSSFGNGSSQTLTTGQGNSSFGFDTLINCSTGGSNCAFGAFALSQTTQDSNTAMGYSALQNFQGSLSTAFGYHCCKNVTQVGNSGFGSLTLANCTSGFTNTAIGNDSLQNLVTGSNNTCLGYGTGSNYTTNESDNICIGRSVVGTTGESNTIRIGNTQTRAFVSGIAGVSVTNTQAVTIDTVTGQLGSEPINTGFLNYLSNLEIYEDFLNFINNGFSAWLTGGGSFVPAQAIAEVNHPGVLGNISNSTGTGVVYLGTDADVTNKIVLGGGALEYIWIFKIVNLSNSTNRYTLSFGMGDTSNASEQANGVYYQYSDNVNSGNWRISTSAASSPTNTDTAVAVTTGWHNARCAVNAAASSIEFFIDGVSLGTINNTIPTLSIRPFFGFTRVAGTIAAGSLIIDLFYLKQTFTTAR